MPSFSQEHPAPEEHPAVAAALRALIATLEAEGVMNCPGGGTAVVDAICGRMDQLGLLDFDDHVAAALLLEAEGWPDASRHARAMVGWEQPQGGRGDRHCARADPPRPWKVTSALRFLPTNHTTPMRKRPVLALMSKPPNVILSTLTSSYEPPVYR